ncbi:MAG: hypothetical protein QOD01_1846, partial [Actinomycetota bacterium]|nr:hypothetical protein [Actinomycetota bacterium]
MPPRPLAAVTRLLIAAALTLTGCGGA